jgi:MYXO-CTERM domain-containing protein
MNGMGSNFTCQCDNGYFNQTPTTCVLMNPCTANPCDRNATCTNPAQGVFLCACNNGYSGNGVHCQLIQPCDSNPCTGGHVTCVVTQPTTTTMQGTYKCQCDMGYSNDTPTTCQITNRCDLNPCNLHATCNPDRSKPQCVCNTGYMGDGMTCTPINDCDKSPCGARATCTPTGPGMHRCTCGDGGAANDAGACPGSPDMVSAAHGDGGNGMTPTSGCACDVGRPSRSGPAGAFAFGALLLLIAVRRRHPR